MVQNIPFLLICFLLPFLHVCLRSAKKLMKPQSKQHEEQPDGTVKLCPHARLVPQCGSSRSIPIREVTTASSNESSHNRTAQCSKACGRKKQPQLASNTSSCNTTVERVRPRHQNHPYLYSTEPVTFLYANKAMTSNRLNITSCVIRIFESTAAQKAA